MVPDLPKMLKRWLTGVLLMAGLGIAPLSLPAASAAELTTEAATEAMHRAVRFFRTHCSAGGGYVYRVSADGRHRQGEVAVGATTAWLEPPGTPAVGMAYLNAYRLTRDPVLLEAAKETADALIRTQLVSGGWEDGLEFDPAARKQRAFRVELGPSPQVGKLRNNTTFDDDKSQSAVRFLMQLDRELKFEDARLHEAARYALDAFVKAQYPNGAWPQRYAKFPVAADFPVRQASIPETWPPSFEGVPYSSYYTLNDNTITDLITSLLDAWDVYQEPRYLEAARRGGDFLLLAQLPEPQPGWAQQYNVEMHPAWARKFEPPALSGGESQGAMRTLMTLYRRTGDAKYLEPIDRALAYYRRSLLPDGRLARFYELGTNRPLYFTREYKLVYTDDDLPTHYSFKVSQRLDALEAEYNRVRETPRDSLWKPASTAAPKPSSELSRKAQAAVAALDARGAWVETGEILTLDRRKLRTELMDSKTFASNLQTLASYIAANSPAPSR